MVHKSLSMPTLFKDSGLLSVMSLYTGLISGRINALDFSVLFKDRLSALLVAV